MTTEHAGRKGLCLWSCSASAPAAASAFRLSCCPASLLSVFLPAGGGALYVKTQAATAYRQACAGGQVLPQARTRWVGRLGSGEGPGRGNFHFHYAWVVCLVPLLISPAGFVTPLHSANGWAGQSPMWQLVLAVGWASCS